MKVEKYTKMTGTFELARKLGVCPQTIWKVRTGKAKSARISKELRKLGLEAL